jgi:integrase
MKVSSRHVERKGAAMSVDSYKTKDGTRYRVRWRDHGQARARSFTSRREANAFDVEVKARKQRGEALPTTTRETLGEAWDEFWKLRGYRLASNTQLTYKQHWAATIEGEYDHYPVRQFISEPSIFDAILAGMEERGAGPASQRKMLTVLSAVFAVLVEWKRAPVNPVAHVKKPEATPKRIPHPFPPMVVERIRLKLRRRTTKDESGVRALADACLVCLMAYAGLRPGEALALTWGDVGQRTLAIDKAIALGESGPTKTRSSRSAPLVGALAADLAELRKARGNPGDDELVIPSMSGGPWTQSQYNNWRSRVWRKVMKDLAGGDPPQPRLATSRPYDCRGSFVSLQLRAGASPLEVARWAGHSPQVMYDHYANVIDELEGEPRLSAVEQIERARQAVAALEQAMLDKLMDDLMAHPTVAAALRDNAASLFFDPEAKAPIAEPLVLTEAVSNRVDEAG